MRGFNNNTKCNSILNPAALDMFERYQSKMRYVDNRTEIAERKFRTPPYYLIYEERRKEIERSGIEEDI